MLTETEAGDRPSSSVIHPSSSRLIFTVHPCLIELSGIIIHKTKNAFKIITRIKSMLPKQNTIFTFAVPLCFTLPTDYDPKTHFPIPLHP
ncbi:hypothetical protein BDN72DRAFT_848395 [Pluteus cervinus]|uniref:Uncharacterized protein n=1 Tax=Pluteus cervinus TaxID=181527 RepID=A0ACD3AA13_9AGAR|nr:hypothetical protein BDN72DRAFT_848395 [Pluteus cervinus]